ncbi:hypothetical protein C0J52_23862 [Blattella germanica]|nr:hypothetical protein C0J52_23862 [Blattella germanica]
MPRWPKFLRRIWKKCSCSCGVIEDLVMELKETATNFSTLKSTSSAGDSCNASASASRCSTLRMPGEEEPANATTSWITGEPIQRTYEETKVIAIYGICEISFSIMQVKSFNARSISQGFNFRSIIKINLASTISKFYPRRNTNLLEFCFKNRKRNNEISEE